DDPTLANPGAKKVGRFRVGKCWTAESPYP
ncbi:MAG: hypothetical protein ACI8W8_001333, partial [Rhodothermales bacterium]